MGDQPLDLYDIAWFFSKVDVKDKRDCWEFRGHKAIGGYGNVTIRGQHYYAHRLSYEIFCGEIPKDMVIRHVCDNAACCNPCHLTTGTQMDNVVDRMIRGRSAVGSRNGRSKLTEDEVRQILEDRRSAPAVAKAYGVGKDTVLRIRRGHSWAHVTLDDTAK